MGAKLLESGVSDFVIVEKADSVGGTWRENTYPGAECDIPSSLYSFSFAQNPTWDFKWAKQAQILDYLENFTTDYGVRNHIRFQTNVLSATWRENLGRWLVETDQGPYECQFLVSAVGQLHYPKWPSLKGMDRFEGRCFHSAQWDHAVDLTDKNVGVIGAAASAIQFIPEIAPKVSQLTVYQRTPNWIIDKGDRPYSRFEKWVAKRFPRLANLYRISLWCQGEYIIYPIIKGARIRSAILKAKSRADMKKYIKDPALRDALTPDYPLGAKRILFSDKYYAALARDNVELVTDAISEVSEIGVETGPSSLRAHDVIICATGFHTNPFLKNLKITGQGGCDLHTHWEEGARAYLGVMTANFPNMFMIFGPNTNTGHTSIIYKIEAQVRYIRQLIAHAGECAIAVKEDAETAFKNDIEARLSDLAWAKIDNSWYKVGERIPNNWPGSAREYKKRLSTPDWAAFNISRPKEIE